MNSKVMTAKKKKKNLIKKMHNWAVNQISLFLELLFQQLVWDPVS